jgi:YebC/PmpR family DNA-binding regulatory protein
MSGHSKWATIKRQKGVTDAKRGQAFTKMSNAITIAVKEGGGVGDPASNFKLRMIIEKARAINMPKDNIQRAIERASGVGGNALTEAVYEGFAPGGIAVMVHTVTDNKMRTVAEVKNIFEKSGGGFGSSGSVAYLFDQKGEITVPLSGKSFDDVMMVALDANIDDIEEDAGVAYMYVSPTDLSRAKSDLEALGLTVTTVELVYKPKSTIDLPDESTQEKVMDFLEKVEDLADVQKVFTNANFA